MFNSNFRGTGLIQGDNHVQHYTHACDYLLIVCFVFVNALQPLSLLSASVFSVSIDPVNNSMAVSGGEDDKAYVWRIQDGETLMECRGIPFLYNKYCHDPSFGYPGDHASHIRSYKGLLHYA